MHALWDRVFGWIFEKAFFFVCRFVRELSYFRDGENLKSFFVFITYIGKSDGNLLCVAQSNRTFSARFLLCCTVIFELLWVISFNYVWLMLLTTDCDCDVYNNDYYLFLNHNVYICKWCDDIISIEVIDFDN
jgi:hypothetical protein